MPPPGPGAIAALGWERGMLRVACKVGDVAVNAPAKRCAAATVTATKRCAAATVTAAAAFGTLAAAFVAALDECSAPHGAASRLAATE